MRRHVMGLIGLTALLAGVGALVYFSPPSPTIAAAISTIVGMGDGWRGSGSELMLSSMAIRAGVVLVAGWLAWPQLEQLFKRFPLWLMGLVALCVFLLIAYPQSAFIVAPLLGIIAVVQFIRYLFTPLPAKPKAKGKKPKKTGAKKRKKAAVEE